MKITWMRRTVVAVLLLGCALTLTLMLVLAQPAVAEPADVTPLPPVTNVDGFASVCYAYYYEPGNRPFLPLTHDAGARHDRVDFRWDALINGYGGYDSLVDDEWAAGIDLIGILMATPEDFRKPGCPLAAGLASETKMASGERPPGWYAPEVGRAKTLAPAASDPGACPPAGLYNTWTVGDFNGNHWAEFVYNTVVRYQDRVKQWEMWNEVEWDWFWLGSEAEYAQLLKVGYQAVKAADPDATVLFAGLHYWADPTYFERVLDILNDDPTAPDNNYFFDVMSVHLYSRASTTYDVVNQIRSRMMVYVPDRPIWLTETGVPVYDGDYPGVRSEYSATEVEAAAYLIQSYANAIAADVGRYHWFRVHDDVMSEHFGLTHDENYFRPAYIAYQVAATYLVSPTFVTRVPDGSNMRVTLWGTPRGKVSVLWNDNTATSVYTLPAVLPTATFVDRLGVTRIVIATNILPGTLEYHVYTTTLPGATAHRPYPNENDYIIGGDPFIIIESETLNEPPTSTVHSLPAMTTTLALTVTWEGWDNESGVWLYDIQLRDGASGEWTDWQPSTTVTSSQFTGEHGHTYYFRSRATDRVGNREAWPDEPQAHVTLDLTATLQISIGTFFADENRNGVWDDSILNGSTVIFEEITLTQVSLHLLDGTGHDVFTPVVTRPWAFTTTIYYADRPYRLRTVSTDGEYVRTLPITITWSGGGEAYTYTYNVLGLYLVERIYLPLVLRNG
ncbi:MAG: hypothetical protein GY832_10520 [Chloroflexi bacterium]|nr:hypothetical protein [Chloroflexota bacterium]